MSPESALIVCRFLQDSSAMLLWGAFAYLSWLVPADLSRQIDMSVGSLRLLLTAVAVAAVVLAFPLEVASVGDGWADAFDPSTISAVVFETSIGTALLARAFAGLLLLGCLFAPPRARPQATALASGVLLASLALSGHAAMQEGWPGWAHRINDALHVLAAGAWLGALPLLLPILRSLDDPGQRGDAETALMRFSTVGHTVVALVLVTGAVNTALIVGWPVDLSSLYQALLLAKIACVAAMVVLAIVNRYVLVPRLHDNAVALTLFKTGTIAEIVVGLLVIGLVSWFGTLAPA
jgi:putative copper resistance protein D